MTTLRNSFNVSLSIGQLPPFLWAMTLSNFLPLFGSSFVQLEERQ
jgi:hypothetical protein